MITRPTLLVPLKSLIVGAWPARENRIVVLEFHD